uniref:hypothetical protein n=1 Tax=Psychrobacter sp. TaxID=56811 RepID=UPI00159A284A|nr:hypothetical protein [Psychrobacter sp.]QJS05514.1 hypothetical protein [Psychrobacter sp.]
MIKEILLGVTLKNVFTRLLQILWAVVVMAFSLLTGAILFGIIASKNMTVIEVLNSPSADGIGADYFYLAFAFAALILIQYLLLGNFDPRRLINPKD